MLALQRERMVMAGELVKPIASCVARQDTDHPAFHGCVDWHSAVHGVWALLAYARATGDHGPAEALANSILTPENIAAERDYLRRRPDFEAPYGRAWFLRLAIEYRLLHGDGRLTGMADDVFDSLLAYYRRRGIDPRSGAYDSDSWALINMYDYAEAGGHEVGRELVKGWIAKFFARSGAACQSDWEGSEFMAVCTNWAWLASKVLDRAEFQKWLEAFFRDSGPPKPVKSPRGWHAYGLNFSRAWGLWRIYRASGDDRYAQAYVAHVKETYDRPDAWRGSYYGVAHWVPQFGMFAIQPLFGSARQP